MLIHISTEEALKIAIDHFEKLFPNDNILVKLDDTELLQKRVVEVVKEVSFSNKIKAIKYFRAVTGLGLADAKMGVEHIMDNIPVSFDIKDHSAVERSLDY